MTVLRILILSVIFYIFLFNYADTQQKCCWRHVLLEQISSSTESNKEDENVIRTAFGSVFQKALLDRCPPLRVEVTERKFGYLERIDQPYERVAVDHEYIFRGKLSIEKTGGWDTTFRIWTLKMDLIDKYRGNTIKTERTVWKGHNALEGDNSIKSLASSFMPLNHILHGYERTPESATVVPEKERIMAGKVMKVQITGLQDSEGRPPQPWQRVLARADRGNILNGTPKAEYNVFEVGNGTITLIYRAPEKCEKDMDTIFIYNTCVINPDQQALPQREIAGKQFDIYCFRGRIQVDLMNYEEAEYTIIKRASVQVPFEVDPSGRPDEDVVLGHREFTEDSYKVVRHRKDSLEEITGNFGVRVTGGTVGYQNNPLPFIWQPMEGYVGPYISLAMDFKTGPEIVKKTYKGVVTVETSEAKIWENAWALPLKDGYTYRRDPNHLHRYTLHLEGSPPSR